MKNSTMIKFFIVVIGLVMLSCNLMAAGNQGVEETQVALSVEQTRFAMEQAAADEAEQPVELPTYTPYPTFTPEVTEEPREEPTMPFDPPETDQDTVSGTAFDDWLQTVNILVYEDMWGSDEPLVVSEALDALRLDRNTTYVRDAVGDLISNMNSATPWDLIIIASEARNRMVAGETFDLLNDQLDRGVSVIIEIWYIDQIASGRIQPLMQYCGIAFHQNWWRETHSDRNNYLVYLLQPDHPVFSEPNTIGMLIPYDVLWFDDVGDTVRLIPGSEAVLLAGRLPQVSSDYGLITTCLDGRMIWQTFSTHDYRNEEMLNLWQNYIINTLQARYDYLLQ